MSIYIKDIDMPKENNILEVRIYPSGKVSMVYDIKCEQIATAIELSTPHGDLVDHSEIGPILIKALDECEISEADKGHIIREVWTAPTIIEGEVE